MEVCPLSRLLETSFLSCQYRDLLYSYSEVSLGIGGLGRLGVTGCRRGGALCLRETGFVPYVVQLLGVDLDGSFET